MIAFSSLLSAERNWSPVWLTFSAFAMALVVARLFFGHTPDKLGGAKVGLACVFVEAAGLALIWFASSSAVAALGLALYVRTIRRLATARLGQVRHEGDHCPLV